MTGEMAQGVKCLLCRHGDMKAATWLNLSVQNLGAGGKGWWYDGQILGAYPASQSSQSSKFQAHFESLFQKPR